MIQVFIGIIAGIISGIGMGGGTVLIYLLTTLTGLEQHIAQAVNLIFFIHTSISAIIVNIKNKKINFKLGLIISLCGIIGAIIGAKISINTNVNQLKKYFGYFLAIVAINEIYQLTKEYKKKKKRHNN